MLFLSSLDWSVWGIIFNENHTSLIQKWRSKYTSSQRALDEARSEIKFKADKIHNLELKIEGLESEYKKELQSAKEKLGSHSKCRKEIDLLKEAVNQKEVQLAGVRNEMEDVRKFLQGKVEMVLKEKEEEHGKYVLKLKEERESLIKEVRMIIISLYNLQGFSW